MKKVNYVKNESIKKLEPKIPSGVARQILIGGMKPKKPKKPPAGKM